MASPLRTDPERRVYSCQFNTKQQEEASIHNSAMTHAGWLTAKTPRTEMPTTGALQQGKPNAADAHSKRQYCVSSGD